MKRLVFNDGNGQSYRYEKSGSYYNGVSGAANDTVFKKLGMERKESWDWAEKIYGTRPTGAWPSTHQPHLLDRLVYALKDKWLDKFAPASEGRAFVLIDGEEYKRIARPSEKGRSYSEEFSRGTVLTLPIKFIDEPVEVKIKSSYLDFGINHHSILDKIGVYLKNEHGTTLTQLCTSAYGYKAGTGVFPDYRDGDMGAATAIYRKLKSLLCGSKVPAAVLYEDTPSYKAEHHIEKPELDAYGYPTKRYKKGDIVEVLQAPADRYFKGWKNVWARGMGHAVGNTYEVVTDAAHNGVLLMDPKTKVVSFTFPHHILKLSEGTNSDTVSSKPKAQLISTDLDLDIPLVL